MHNKYHMYIYNICWGCWDILDVDGLKSPQDPSSAPLFPCRTSFLEMAGVEIGATYQKKMAYLVAHPT